MARKITVGMLLFPGFQMLDIAGPGDAFSEVRILSGGQASYEILTIGTRRGLVPSSSGISFSPDRTLFDPCPHLDTLIIPGGLGIFETLDDTTITDWIRGQSKDCRRVGAICNGLFALGAAGMLNGKRVTTHWMDVPRLASSFPRAIIEPDHIYIKDGSLYTTAGVTAGIDLALALIEEDHGKQMAQDVAKYLVVYLRRNGGQSQFSPLLEVQGKENSVVAMVQSRILNDLTTDHTPSSLAEQVQMSERNLARLFKKESGLTIMNFVNDARVDAARRYLESTDLGLSDIARRCGFERVDTMRRIFVHRLEITPADYRSRFRGG
ncbi:GlxA family transcriptional regulator [Herbaspirillum huttiense]|uniref:GlxA family transcriptional regulator n=1 Tax=Herbaspirillum huttiense TaxID=863372 RepID=UPI0039AEBF86